LRERASACSLCGVVRPPDSCSPYPIAPLNDADPSNGWDAVAHVFIPQAGQSTIGATTVRRWASSFGPAATLLDLACGPGGPRAAALGGPERTIYAIDAAPQLTASYRQRFPRAQVACEPVQTSSLFGRTYDGILAWGLVFLLAPEDQMLLLHRVANALRPGGRFLFTAPAEMCEWPDSLTGRRSVALGRTAYEAELTRAGLALVGTELDEGANHYYHVHRRDDVSERGAASPSGPIRSPLATD
jgi:SAM-dependent methyltransferase